METKIKPIALENLNSENLIYLQNISTDFSCIENSCLFAHIDTPEKLKTEDLDILRSHISGFAVFMMLRSGHMSINFNYDHFSITGPAVLSVPDGTTIQFDAAGCSDVDLYLVIYSRRYLQEVNITLNSISSQALFEHDSPVLKLDEHETSMTLRYLKLMHSVMQDNFNLQINRHIVANLTAALFYQTLAVLYKKVEYTSQTNTSQRRSNYVHQFLKLVHLHYTRERSVDFYASKLFISPKYLSLLVKEATGRSAVRWIDHFVIMEAKNLLRYSGKNIQQVAYALNFSNQSSFGKYFKHNTGMSPTEFQKSL